MRTIPSYELYGDLLASGLSDAVHHETIKERSSQHDWSIRLHRHRKLGQLFLFESPGVFFRIGDVEHTSTEAMILIIPPETPHGFVFAKDVAGHVVSLRLDELPPDIQMHFGHLSTETDMVFPANETPNFEGAAHLIGQLGQSYHSIGIGRSDILTAQVHLIMLYLLGKKSKKSALGRPDVSGIRNRQETQIEAFCNLIEGHFQDGWSVGDYANQLGISAPHLTRLCRSGLGSPPNSLVRQRRLIEAKRLLEYTDLSIAEISHRCGFRDAAFFSRTFKSNIKMTPQAYRKDRAPISVTK